MYAGHGISQKGEHVPRATTPPRGRSSGPRWLHNIGFGNLFSPNRILKAKSRHAQKMGKTKKPASKRLNRKALIKRMSRSGKG